MNKFIFKILMVCIIMTTTNCGYNTLVTLDEESKSSWSEVLNQYKRRSDLIPNLVKVVQGYAKHEQETLTQVMEARSKASSIQLTPQALNDPLAFQKFQRAQGEISSALQRLMVVTEKYPELKANEQFANLSSSLEGTENRITVARNRFIQTVKDFNIKVRSFPNNLTAGMFGFSLKPNFTVENEQEIQKAPEIKFE